MSMRKRIYPTAGTSGRVQFIHYDVSVIPMEYLIIDSVLSFPVSISTAKREGMIVVCRSVSVDDLA